MHEATQIFTEESCMPNRKILYCSIIGTILGPCLGHIRAMFWLFLHIFVSIWLNWLKFPPKRDMHAKYKIFFDVYFFGPHFDHVLAILGPCFNYFYNIFASRCLKWLKFALMSHAGHFLVRKYSLILTYWNHIEAMFGHIGALFGYFYNKFASRCLKWYIFSLKSHAC